MKWQDSDLYEIEVIYKIVIILFNNKILPENIFQKQIHYIELLEKIKSEFSTLSDVSFSTRMEDIEDLVTTQVTNKLDTSVVNFYEYNRNDARTIRDIIKNKQKFPKEDFIKLSKNFAKNQYIIELIDITAINNSNIFFII